MRLLLLSALVLSCIIKPPAVSVFLHPFWIALFLSLILKGVLTATVEAFRDNPKFNLVYDVVYVSPFIYGLAVGFLYKVFVFLVAGMILNILVMCANGYRMPVCRTAFVQLSLGCEELGSSYCLTNESTRLSLLCDRIGHPLGISSAGDILVDFSVITFSIARLF